MDISLITESSLIFSVLVWVVYGVYLLVNVLDVEYTSLEFVFDKLEKALARTRLIVFSIICSGFIITAFLFNFGESFQGQNLFDFARGFYFLLLPYIVLLGIVSIEMFLARKKCYKRILVKGKIKDPAFFFLENLMILVYLASILIFTVTNWNDKANLAVGFALFSGIYLYYRYKRDWSDLELSPVEEGKLFKIFKRATEISNMPEMKLAVSSAEISETDPRFKLLPFYMGNLVVIRNVFISYLNEDELLAYFIIAMERKRKKLNLLNDIFNYIPLYLIWLAPLYPFVYLTSNIIARFLVIDPYVRRIQKEADIKAVEAVGPPRVTRMLQIIGNVNDDERLHKAVNNNIGLTPIYTHLKRIRLIEEYAVANSLPVYLDPA